MNVTSKDTSSLNSVCHRTSENLTSKFKNFYIYLLELCVCGLKNKFMVCMCVCWLVVEKIIVV